MTHRELLDRIGPVLRRQAPQAAPWLLSEIDRWCEGDFDGEPDPDYPCCFCRRPPSATRLFLGCSANLAPDGTILGPKFHTVIPPGWLGSEMVSAPFPLMVCDDCVRAYESLLEEDTLTLGRGLERPKPAEVLAQTAAALRGAGEPDAEALCAELGRRFARSTPREIRRGTCTLCKREHPRVVHGDEARICGSCMETARDSLRRAFGPDADAPTGELSGKIRRKRDP